jgi:MFS family permease
MKLKKEGIKLKKTSSFKRDKMFYKFSMYGFLKNLRFFDPFLILFFREVGLSFLQIGVLLAVRDITTNIFEIPTGMFADIFGRRKSMLLSFTSYILSFLIFFFFPNYYLYIFAMVLFALGEAFRSGTHKAMILEYLRLNGWEDQKVEYYGSTRAASQLGSAVSSLIAAALVFYRGSYRIVFLASVIPYLVNLVNLATYPEELDNPKDVSSQEKLKLKSKIKSTFMDFVYMFKNLSSLKPILNSSLFDSFFKITKEYLQPIVKEFALILPLMVSFNSTQRVSVVVGIIYFLLYLLTSYSSKNASKFSKRFKNLSNAINLTYLSGAIFLLLAGITNVLKWNVFAIILFVLFYMLQNVRRPMNVSLISERIPSRTMATGLSVESQLTTTFKALIAIGIGALADKFGVGVSLLMAGSFMFGLYKIAKID